MSLKNLFSKAFFKTANRTLVPRAPRVRVNHLHDVVFNAKEPDFAAPLFIDNISETGIGLVLPANADFTSLTTIFGELKMSGTTQEMRLQVVRFHGDFVGALIESPTANYRLTLKTYFESEIAALHLRATRTEHLKPVSNGTPHWFQGSNNCDLSYISSGNEVVEFEISVFGNHIEGGLNKTLRFSAISEKESKESARYKASELLTQQNAPDEKMRILAKRVINAVENLPPDHRDSILKALDS